MNKLDRPKPWMPNNCPIITVTGDGKAAGRCTHFVGRAEQKQCPLHGDVTKEVGIYVSEGLMAREDKR